MGNTGPLKIGSPNPEGISRVERDCRVQSWVMAVLPLSDGLDELRLSQSLISNGSGIDPKDLRAYLVHCEIMDDNQLEFVVGHMTPLWINANDVSRAVASLKKLISEEPNGKDFLIVSGSGIGDIPALEKDLSDKIGRPVKIAGTVKADSFTSAAGFSAAHIT